VSQVMTGADLVENTIDLFLDGQILVFDKRVLGQTNEHQRHFNDYVISVLYGEIDSIQTSLKLLFTLQQ
jgi:hypothetical protein